MVDMVYPSSGKWANDDKASRQEMNRLRSDLLYWGKIKKSSKDNDQEGVIQAVDVGTFFQRYIFNCRPELLGTTAIRVPYTADRPQTININGFMLQATANVDSSVYAGAANTIYILAIRTDGSTTFTIACRTSATEGTDERLIGDVYWDGAAFDAPLLNTYELEGFGLRPSDTQIIKAWVSFTGATGVILSSFNITSVVRDGAGNWTVTWDTDFVDTTYMALATPFLAADQVFAFFDTFNANNVRVLCSTNDGNLIDATTMMVLAIGAQV